MHALNATACALSESLTHVHTCAGKVCIFVGKEVPLRVCSNLFVWLFVVIVSYKSLITQRRRKNMRVTKREDISC